MEEGDALVVATSGSTGAPKGVVHTHASVAASARASSARLAVDPARDRWLGCLPLAHIGGLSVVTRAVLTGTPLELHPRFDAAAVDDAARRGATLVSVVPTALARIDAGGFRKLVVGGAAPPDRLPPNAVTSYGSTETGSACAYDGVALDGVELRLAPDGEIQVRGDVLLRAYRDGSDPRLADGWYPTGDHGRLDPDGRLEVDGRLDDLIITGGENVWPQAVEAVLAATPAVAEVAVVGRPDPEWGQQVVALVVSGTGPRRRRPWTGCATWSRPSCRPTPPPASSSWSRPCPAPCWARSNVIASDRHGRPPSRRQGEKGRTTQQSRGRNARVLIVLS